MEGKKQTGWRRWTDEEVEYLKTNCPNMSYSDIAKKFGVKRRRIMSKAIQLRINKHKHWSNNEINFLKENYNKMLYKDIAKVLGVKNQRIHSKASELGLIRNKKYSKKEIDFIKENYQNMTDRELAKTLKRKLANLRKKRHNMGLRRYKINVLKSCRKNIIRRLTLEKSYILGVILGDGYVVPKCYRIGLYVKDREFAKKFRKCIINVYGKCSINKFHDKDRLVKTNGKTYLYKNKTYFTSQIHSKKACKDIMKYLSTGNPTPTEILNSNNKEIIISFLEGLYDSEGSISSKKYRGFIARRIVFYNKDYRLIQNVITLLEKLNIRPSKPTISKYSGVYSLQTSAKKSVLNFCNNIHLSIPKKQMELNILKENSGELNG